MWAALIDDRLLNEGANAYLYWCFIGSTCLTYPSGSPPIAIRDYVFGQYSDFVRPGMYRIDATHIPQSGVTVSAYQNTSTN
jgi:O-glycosyl hydrolase